MNYYWMYYNTTSGDLASQHSTHSPYIADGSFDTSLVPSGNTVLGPYDDSGNNPMSADFNLAYDNPQAWLYQSGKFVSNPNYGAIQLQQVATAQIASITAAMNAALAGGFTSKTTGHTYVTTIGGQSNLHGELTRFQLDSSLTSVQFYTLDAGWIAHTQAEIQGAFLDGGSWKDAQYAQAQKLTQQIQTLASQSGTTIAQIQAVVWSEATY